MAKASAYAWPAADFTRIPFGVYRDPDIYEEEQERIFRGPTWNYLCLDAEIPEPGDFRTTYVGDTPVIVNRTADGGFRAFVNRCAHRGAIVRREMSGNDSAHTCCYHQWCYDLEGRLTSIPFRRGVKGKGGLPSDFDMTQHRLRPLRVASLNGAIFGTFSDEVEDLESYLDKPFADHLRRLFNRPVRILGYQRQVLNGNWKLYTDNLRDPNHGGLLHMFQITFGIARLSQWGGAKMDRKRRHNMSYTASGTDAPDGSDSYRDTQRGDSAPQLRDASMLAYRKEFPDQLTLSIASIFPNVVFQQIGNSLATRQVRTRSASEFEIFWTYYGYMDDDESMVQHRLRQANLAGPGGLISMEDGEAVEIVYRAIVRDSREHAVVEIGGRGPIEDQETLVTEVPMRGFWSHYAGLMGIQAGGQPA